MKTQTYVVIFFDMRAKKPRRLVYTTNHTDEKEIRKQTVIDVAAMGIAGYIKCIWRVIDGGRSDSEFTQDDINRWLK